MARFSAKTLLKVILVCLGFLLVVLFPYNHKKLVPRRPTFDVNSNSPLVSTFFERWRPNKTLDAVKVYSEKRPAAQPVDLVKSSGVVLRVTRPGVGVAGDHEHVPNGGEVAVEWAGVPAASKQDWIGLYCPPDSTSDAYLDYWLVREALSSALGHGKFTCNLFNMRVDCEFRYFSEVSRTFTSTTTTQLLAVSNTVTFEGGLSQPMHGHLALTRDPTEMQVQWTSGLRFPRPEVRYGLRPDALNTTTFGVSQTYKQLDLCGPTANLSRYFHDPGFLHKVLLTNLKPATKYFYQFGSRQKFSDVRSFTTALPRGDPRSFAFITYADMGVYRQAQKTAEAALFEVQKGAAFVLHPGDLSYAVGFAYIWEQWMTLIEPYASLAPYMVAVGNHEETILNDDPRGTGFHPPWGSYGHDSRGECGVPTFMRFPMPGTERHKVSWYSFDYGLTHFTVFSTEHDFTQGSVQYQWLEADLSSVDRAATPWLVVAGHRPMYSSENYPEEMIVGEHLRLELEGLLSERGVDLVIWGHLHSYERTCPVFNHTCTAQGQGGVVHITLGTAGYPLDHMEVFERPWSRHYEATFGYGRVTLANRSALLWEFVSSDLENNQVLDSTWLLK